MPNCHEMKKGEIYVCEDCGVELKVVKQCKEFGTPAEECSCNTTQSHCTLTCCGKDLLKKT